MSSNKIKLFYPEKPYQQNDKKRLNIFYKILILFVVMVGIFLTIMALGWKKELDNKKICSHLIKEEKCDKYEFIKNITDLKEKNSVDFNKLKGENRDLREKLTQNRHEILNKELENRQSEIVVNRKKEIIQNQYFISCYDFGNGEWEIPKHCINEINMFFNNQNVGNSFIVIINGVIDKKPYIGSNKELKQVGLASMRANAISNFLYKYENHKIKIYYKRQLQKDNKRGYQLEIKEKIIDKKNIL
jgi:hypothetical protein